MSEQGNIAACMDDSVRFFERTTAGLQSIPSDCMGHQNAGILDMARGYCEAWQRASGNRQKETLGILSKLCGADPDNVHNFMMHLYNRVGRHTYQRAVAMAFLGHHPVFISKTLGWPTPVTESFATDKAGMEAWREIAG